MNNLKLLTFTIIISVLSCNTQKNSLEGNYHDCELVKMDFSADLKEIYEDLDHFIKHKGPVNDFENNVTDGVLLFKVNLGLSYGDLIIFNSKKDSVICQKHQNISSKILDISFKESTNVKNLISDLNEAKYIHECKNSPSPFYLFIVKRNGKEIVQYVSMSSPTIDNTILTSNESKMFELFDIIRSYNYIGAK